MKFNEVFSMLKQLNIPVAYDHFDSPPSIPFITYSDSGSNHVYADNSVYKRALYVEIELYTDKKDLSIENKLEDLLDERGIVYSSYPTIWIDSEKLYQKIYEIGVEN